MRRRILTLAVGLTTAMILAFAVPLAFLVFRDVESSALDRARFQAQAVASFIAGGPGEPHISQRLSRERDEHDSAIWVRTPTARSWAGNLLASPSPSSPILTPTETGDPATSPWVGSTT